jgi:hypothetical protein
MPEHPPIRAVVDRAELRVRSQGPFAAAAAHRFTRADTTLHHALQQPTGAPETVPTPPPPPPGEAYLREQLGLAVAALTGAIEAQRQAEATHRRAEQHREQCRQRLTGFGDLDGEMNTALAESLRAGADPETVREAFGGKLSERARAVVDLTAAETVTATLKTEQVTATERATKAADAVNGLAMRVLSFVAEGFATEIRYLRAEISRRRKALLAYDRMTANSLGLSMTVRHAIGDEPTSLELANVDVEAWKRAAVDLRADPQAKIEIPLPELTLPPLPVPWSYSGGAVERAVPIQRREELPAMDDGDPHQLSEA